MGSIYINQKEMIINKYKREGIKLALQAFLNYYSPKTFDAINEILIEFAQASKIKDFKVEEYKNDLFDLLHNKKLIETIEKKYKPYHPEGPDKELCEKLNNEINDLLKSIAERFNKEKNDFINSLEVKQFVEYIFDNNNWFDYIKVINLITNFCIHNNLNSNINIQINTIINAILKDNDTLKTIIISKIQEEHLKNKIKENKKMVEEYLYCKIKDRDERLVEERKEKEQCVFIQTIIQCYKEKGLREALINLHTNSNNIEEDLKAFIKTLYISNNINYIPNDLIIELVKNMNFAKATTKDILDNCKAYKGELPSYLKEKLDETNKIYNTNLDELIKIINKDFNERQTFLNVNLPLKEFINIIIHKITNPTKEKIYDEIIKYCELRELTISYDETLNGYLESIIRIIDIKRTRKTTQDKPTMLDERYNKVVNNLVEYIKVNTNKTILDEEETTYYEISQLTQENLNLYSQIESIYKQIELNENKKIELTLKYQNKVLKK